MARYLKKANSPDRSRVINLERRVREIIEDVALRGDEALTRYNTQFDGNTRIGLRVSEAEIKKAYELTPEELIRDLQLVAGRLEKFAARQKETLQGFEDFQISPGISLAQKIMPVESCCCYIPGGGYPLYSTALMMGITAAAAGVERIAMCTPAVYGTENVHPSTLVAMDLAGIHEIYALSGAHAVAAFACGTEQITPVDLFVGPGNQYVTEAKRQCCGRFGIDFLAGPSEILVLADSHASPSFIAADLLSESEHDVLAIARLITTDYSLGERVMDEIGRQIKGIETEDIASVSWENNGEIIVADTIEEACDLANRIAPEHLELQLREEERERAAALLKHYGTLFIGPYSAVVYSDYVNGINHTLPTGRAARYTGGLWIGTFSKVCTVQEVTRDGARQIAQVAEKLAEGEGFPGHAAAARIRLN